MGSSCGTVSVLQSSHFWSHNLFRMCTCISTCIYVNLYSLCLLHPLWVVNANIGSPVWHCVCCSHPTSDPTPWIECVYVYVHVFMLKWIPMSPQIPMHSLMETWLPCMAQCMFSSLIISVPIPCLECVHASVHVFMSTWLSMSSPPPMSSYMEKWVTLCGTACVLQSSHLWFHNLARLCTCISTCIYVNLTLHVFSTPMSS